MMKSLGLLAMVAYLTLTGCDKPQSVQEIESSYIADVGSIRIEKIRINADGVTCYRNSFNSAAFSCIKDELNVPEVSE